MYHAFLIADHSACNISPVDNPSREAARQGAVRVDREGDLPRGRRTPQFVRVAARRCKSDTREWYLSPYLLCDLHLFINKRMLLSADRFGPTRLAFLFLSVAGGSSVWNNSGVPRCTVFFVGLASISLLRGHSIHHHHPCCGPGAGFSVFGCVRGPGGAGGGGLGGRWVVCGRAGRCRVRRLPTVVFRGHDRSRSRRTPVNWPRSFTRSRAARI